MFFPTTHWTQLAQASLNGETAARAALEAFCRAYREPVHRFILGRGIVGPEAEDLTHEFLLHMMEKSALRRADPARGRFRSFLAGALMNFLHDAADRRNAQKRGGGAAHVSFDDEISPGIDAEVTAARAEEALFDREWAVTVMERALARIQEEQTAAGKAGSFPVLQRFLPAGGEPVTYQRGAAELGLSEAAFTSEVHRLRQRFRALVRAEIAATVSAPHEIDGEMRHLQEVLMNPGTGLRNDGKGGGANP